MLCLIYVQSITFNKNHLVVNLNRKQRGINKTEKIKEKGEKSPVHFGPP
jgi:hypothetical protein